MSNFIKLYLEKYNKKIIIINNKSKLKTKREIINTSNYY